MATATERIARLEQVVKGNGSEGLIDRMSTLEKQNRRHTYLLIATLTASGLGGMEGLVHAAQMIWKVIL